MCAEGIIVKSWVSPSKYHEKAESGSKPNNPNPLSGDTKTGATLYLRYLGISIVNFTHTKHRIPPKKTHYFQAFVVFVKRFLSYEKKNPPSASGVNCSKPIPQAHQLLIFDQNLALPRQPAFFQSSAPICIFQLLMGLSNFRPKFRTKFATFSFLVDWGADHGPGGSAKVVSTVPRSPISKIRLPCYCGHHLSIVTAMVPAMEKPSCPCKNSKPKK